MSLRLLFLITLGVCSRATDVAADFEKACQAGDTECIDSLDEMYLIQKHVEVGTSALETTANKTHPLKKDLPIATKGDIVHDLHAKTPKVETKTATHSAALDAKGSATGPTVTTKGGGGGDKSDDKDKDKPSCPEGFTPEPGQDDKEDVFGQAPKSLASDMDSCASDCANHSACGSFEFGDSKCYLNTRSNPKDKLSDSDKKMTFCSKQDDCTFVWPWTYWNKTHSIERNAWNAWNTEHRCWFTFFVWCLITWIIWVILGVLCWKLFFGPDPDIYEDFGDFVDVFESGHFDCMRRPKICFCAFCCPAVQWAVTENLAGFIHVGAALGIFYSLCLLQGFASYATPILFPGVLTCILIVVFRQKLRRKLGCQPDTFVSYFHDITYAFFCPWCAIAQEAQVVLYAYSQNHLEPVRQPTRVVRKEVVSSTGSSRVIRTQPQVISSAPTSLPGVSYSNTVQSIRQQPPYVGSTGTRGRSPPSGSL